MPLEIREMVIKTNVVQRMENAENGLSRSTKFKETETAKGQITSKKLNQFKEELLAEIPAIIERILAQQMRHF